jgi:hypothetical protein
VSAVSVRLCAGFDGQDGVNMALGVQVAGLVGRPVQRALGHKLCDRQLTVGFLICKTARMVLPCGRELGSALLVQVSAG